MHCPSCDTPNEDSARFCRVCGASLAATTPQYVISNAPVTGESCPSCRQRNPAGAKYCVFCATPLVQPSPAAWSPAQAPLTPATVAPIYAPQQPPSVAVTIYTAPQSTQVVVARGGNLLLRAIWFILVGWWLGLIWTMLAWLFNLTIIGLPVGIMMLNVIPQVMTLRPRTPGVRTVQAGPGSPIVAVRQAGQPLVLRALWFLFIGSWASLLWMLTAWCFCATVILMPIAFWMFDRVPTISTLAAE